MKLSSFIGSLTLLSMMSTGGAGLYNRFSSHEYQVRMGEFTAGNSDVQVIEDTLTNAHSGDTVDIHIMSPGGSIAVLLDLINAIDARPDVRVVMYNDGFAMSCGAVLAMYGNELHVRKYSVFLVHMGRTIDADGTVHILPVTDPVQKIMFKIMDDTEARYLTFDQLRSVVMGKDVFIDGPTLVRQGKFNPDAQKNHELLQLLLKSPTTVEEPIVGTPGH